MVYLSALISTNIHASAHSHSHMTSTLFAKGAESVGTASTITIVIELMRMHHSVDTPFSESVSPRVDASIESVIRSAQVLCLSHVLRWIARRCHVVSSEVVGCPHRECFSKI